ncbi:GlsB/YeaQ/YmgE family stress response membrane protein [Methylocaldum sp.]|uniref:GlsB/YeaQ/YmgE family stress response membrane protein n=1 Tax=Methylocaldum sp. TaxID=1969727 RepID=UPI002D62B5B7|nr:GlsB/YeaQ/YmgE family stress response membrane protein [Methylocaldum sp.]HYE36137.1 GlsB/YeaQ/YmgE family stress response membrane protein [Methylocaldum sp.]
MELMWYVLIGLAAGWLAGQLVKGGGFGAIGDIIVGVFGAVLGGVLFDVLGLSAGGGRLASLIVATVGAVVFLLLLRLIRKT